MMNYIKIEEGKEQVGLTRESLEKFANSINLNLEDFNTCMNETQISKQSDFII